MATVRTKQQRGMALPISLVLLIAITVLGVATLTNTRLNEQITSNAQQKSIAFEVAESGINAVWDRTILMTALESIPAGQVNDPDPVQPAGVAPALSSNYDQYSASGEVSVDIDAIVDIRYCRENLIPNGVDLSADESRVRTVGLQFDITSQVTIPNSSTRSEHLQRGELPAPQTGRTANCTTPGV